MSTKEVSLALDMEASTCFLLLIEGPEVFSVESYFTR